MVKARADRLDALAARIVALHPYEVPEHPELVLDTMRVSAQVQIKRIA